MVLDYRVSPPTRLFVSDRGRPSIVDPTKRRVTIVIENDVISLPEEAEILIPSWRRWPIAILFALYSGKDFIFILRFDWRRGLSNQNLKTLLSHKCISMVAVCFISNCDFKILWSK